MRTYQLVLVLKTSLTEANRKKFLETVKEWREKVLAYVIKRQEKGFYQNFVFEAKEDLVSGLEKKLTASDNVLRHLLLRQS